MHVNNPAAFASNAGQEAAPVLEPHVGTESILETARRIRMGAVAGTIATGGYETHGEIASGTSK